MATHWREAQAEQPLYLDVGNIAIILLPQPLPLLRARMPQQQMPRHGKKALVLLG